jgi:hypothetical protein
MMRFRVIFSRLLIGVPFPVALIDVHRAHDAARARRAAELRFMRHRGIDDWHDHADSVQVEAVGGP